MNNFQIHASAGRVDRAEEFNRLFAEIPDDSTVHFEAGEYYIGNKLLLRGKKRITIDAPGCVFVVRNVPYANYRESTDFLHIEECSDLVLYGFQLKMEYHSNLAGRISGIEENAMEVRFSGSPREEEVRNFLDFSGLSENFKPLSMWFRTQPPQDGPHALIGDEIPTTAPERVPTSSRKLPDGTFRLEAPVTNEYWTLGMRVLGIHFYYGLSAFVFRNSHRVRIDHIWISDWGGFGFTILPRCSDFTFDHLRCESENREIQPHSCTADAMHMTGIAGKLKLVNCLFDGIGDDVLNIHTTVFRIAEVAGRKLSLKYEKKVQNFFPKRWAFPGDRLHVLDGTTQELKGTLIAEEVDGNVVTVAPANFAFSAQDYLINGEHAPELEIKYCTVRHSRSRILLDSVSKAEISYCHIDNHASNRAICIASEIEYWCEGGIAQNIEIHHNNIACTNDAQTPRCFMGRDSVDKRQAICAHLNDKNRERLKKKFVNLKIHHNHIKGFVSLDHTENAEISDNIFDMPPEQAVRIDNTCRDISLHDNDCE